MKTAEERDQAARDEAVAWLVRVESDAAVEADWQALAAWLEASPANRRAFDEVERLSAGLVDQAALIVPGLADDSDQPAVVDLTARGALRRPQDRRRLMMAGGGIAAAMVIGIVAFALLRPEAAAPAVEYRTAPGESREITLADGSTIHLNGASQVTVVLGPGERRVIMADAEASFDVASDAGRPFVIDAGDRRVQVVGTEFNVRRHAGRLTVTVREGVVEVRKPGRGAEARLTPGKELMHLEGQPTSTVRQVTAEDAFSWTRGRLVCRDRRLADLVEDLNRQLPTPIVVEGEARELRFSGVLVVDDEQAVLQRLQAFLPVSAVRDGDVIRIRSRSD